MLLLGFITMAIIQSAPPPVVDEFAPPPISYSIRNITRCLGGNVVSAEFAWRNGATMVVDIKGAGHAVSEAERRSINDYLKRLGPFETITASCNGSGQSIIVVHGTPGFGEVASVTILWKSKGFEIFS